MSNLFAYPWFRVDSLNSFVAMAIAVFGVLTLVYSGKAIKAGKDSLRYYAYIILTAAVSIGAALANHLILLLVLWGFLGLTLYLLINMGGAQASSAAKKTFIIVGGTDALMLLGIGIIYYLQGTFQMDKIRIPLEGSSAAYLAVGAYLCVAIASFAKAGAMPFHSWIPDCAEKAPAAVVAFLPASLDKLLGVYLMARLSLDLFVMNRAMNVVLMLVGAFTIIAAVMMALVQHNMKRLLGYHAVSQVGYMVLGIGTGNPLGIAGGLFHMLNHAVYKSCLFFTAGNVEERTGTAELDKLGGLAKAMPITYICALIASCSISGVPPFNGFFSKWMVYQGLINQMQTADFAMRALGVVCLVAAMFGSGLTLASFMKLIHAVYLGEKPKAFKAAQAKEVSVAMWLPCAFLALVCVVFGVWAKSLPLKFMIFPAVRGVEFMGSWYAGEASLLIILGLIAGLLFWHLKSIKPKLRRDTSFVGAEPVSLEDHRVSGTEFYNTVKEFGILKGIYAWAEKGFFDIYEQGKSLVFGIGGFFQYLHNGVLPTYLVWTLLGMIALFFTLVR